MKTLSYLNFAPLIFVLFAILSLAIGLRGILTKRPFFISARWFFIVMLIALVPSIVLGFSTDGFPGVNVISWLNPLLFSLILVMFWFQMRGYMAFGITDQSFRDALHAALHNLNLPFEERLSAVHLPSIGADLQVSVQSWMGTGQLRIKGSEDRSLLSQIVGGMNERFRTSSFATNMTSCIFYAIMGVMMFAGAIMLFIYNRRLPTE